MAKKQRVRIGNSRPRHNWDPDTIENTAGPGSSSASTTGEYSGDCNAPASSGGGVRTIEGVSKHSIHEVGQVGSSFPGTDSYGRDMEGATFAEREKLYVRYDLIEGLEESGMVDDDGFPLNDDDVTVRQYVYDNPTKERESDGTLIRKTEDSTILLPTHDEEYFQHVFSWPTSHPLRTRKIAGFIEETTTTVCTTPASEGQDECTTSVTDVILHPVERLYDVNFTLADVDMELYQANPQGASQKGDKVWNYNQLEFDPVTGQLQNPNGNLRRKLGKPIIYYGDSSSNAIFFNYVPDNTIHTSVVTHDFDDDNNRDNSFNVTGNITVEPKNRGDDGEGTNNRRNRKHYEITFPKAINNTGNIRIHFNRKKTASGISRERLFVSKIKQTGKKKVKVWFETETGGNTFAREWTVSLGGRETSTVDVIGIGDTVNGATVTNVVNYMEEVALLRTAVRSQKKGVQDPNITESDFIALTNPDGTPQGLTAFDYARTRSWIKINDTTDIEPGMELQGRGIKGKTTTVTGVDYFNNIVYISDTIKQKKLKNLKFIDDQCNHVSKHTLCYATLSGGNNFAIDTQYQVSRNGVNTCSIIAKAGKGILNRSAVVGTWFSDVKHEIEYQPLFYGADPECEKELDSDEYGEYTLGTIIWDNDTKTESVYILTTPEDNLAYTASQVHFALTYAPIDKDTLHTILDQAKKEFKSTTKDIEKRFIVFNKVSEHCKVNLGGKKAAAVIDDLCRDDIRPTYFNMYDPITEQSALDVNLTGLQNNILDYCAATNPTLNPALQGAEIAAQNSTVLPEEYYKQFVTNENSLINRLRSGFDIVESTRPKNKIKNLPPQIVGEDQSGRTFTSSSFRNLPPKTDRVSYFCNDLVVTDDKYLNPILNLDPQTTINQPKIILRSKPMWTASNSGQTWTITINTAAGPLTTTMSVTVNNDANGHVGNITTSNGPSATNTVVQGICTITSTINWIPLRSKSARSNAIFCTRDAFPDVYTIATNIGRPPGGDHNDPYAKTDMRDIRYKERPKDDDGEYINTMLSLPTHAVYPAIVWEHNVNYQQDFFKMLEFRLEEHSQLIGETIENKGNPYIDRAVTTKLRKDLKVGDTSITVDSTGEFLSSGYLIIPKYTQKIVSLETGNNNGYYTYSGEEIIYYGSKTETTFNDIQRGMFGTTSGFEEIISVESVEEGVRYKIATLGSSNWKKIGAGKNPSVGDVFTATKHDGVGTGTVTVFGTTSDETPDEKLLTGLEAVPKVAVISSYEKGFSIAQHSVFSLKY